MFSHELDEDEDEDEYESSFIDDDDDESGSATTESETQEDSDHSASQDSDKENDNAPQSEQAKNRATGVCRTPVKTPADLFSDDDVDLMSSLPKPKKALAKRTDVGRKTGKPDSEKKPKASGFDFRHKPIDNDRFKLPGSLERGTVHVHVVIS